jgi:dienelactone hydrolase
MTRPRLSGSKNQWWEDNGYSSMGLVTKGLLNQGFAVLALDAVYHGERQLENDYETPWNLIANGKFVRYREMVLQTVVEYRLALDFLATRADIDTSRIGAVGYSMGGTMTFMLTAKDPRIKVAVACVSPPFGFTLMKGFIDKSVTPQSFQAMAGVLAMQVGVNVQNFARPVGSRPFLMIMADKDDFYSPREAKQLFDLVPSPTKELLFFDSGHSLPPEHAPKVREWFEKHLK